MPHADPLRNPEDASGLSPSGPYRAYKHAGLLLLCVAWITLGLFGHDPWKSDDATNFGIAFDMLQRHDFVVPHLAGAALPDRAPLFPGVAAAGAAAFGAVMPLHDAARLANALSLALTLWLLSLAGRELYGRTFRWLPVLVFIGCAGLWDRAHQLAPEVGLLAAYALAAYAFALSLRRFVLGGLLLGLAIGSAFLCRGMPSAAIMILIAIALLLFKAWRNRSYAAALGFALIAAAPLVAVWPALLHARDAALFTQWLEAQSINRFFGGTAGSPAVEPFYYLKNLPWFAWPALPLAVWTLWIRARGYHDGLATPGIQLPAIMAVIMLVVLSAAAEPRAIVALPLLVPLSLLAAAEIDTLKRGLSGALDWFGILSFGLAGTLVWALWLQSVWEGLPESVARVFRDTQPGFQPPIQFIPITVSLLLTLAWIALVRPARRSNRRTMLNWAVGMTLVWGLYSTIWLPYLDSRRGYRSVAESLTIHLPAATCVASHNLGEPQRALLEYFIGLVTVRDELVPAHSCNALLVQLGRSDPETPPDSAWEKVWEGRRRGDDTERFVLFRRPAARGVL
ncbi:MAG: glycosyltransferase family 39 protein [Betaproteobacteria bacterium]|nr:MAG: glycosyltransferase family 39 protein [Betaproteobacteria bacterium]